MLINHASNMALSMARSVCWPVDPPLWSRLTLLNNYWKVCHEIFSLEDESYEFIIS